MRILRLKDRLSLKVLDTEFIISPLTKQQQSKIQEYIKFKNGEAEVDPIMTSLLTVKYSVKGLSGVKTFDDQEYQLEFADEKKTELTDECAEDLLNLECKNELIMAISAIRSGKYDKVVGADGKELTGVSISYLNESKKN